MLVRAPLSRDTAIANVTGVCLRTIRSHPTTNLRRFQVNTALRRGAAIGALAIGHMDLTTAPEPMAGGGIAERLRRVLTQLETSESRRERHLEHNRRRAERKKRAYHKDRASLEARERAVIDEEVTNDSEAIALRAQRDEIDRKLQAVEERKARFIAERNEVLRLRELSQREIGAIDGEAASNELRFKQMHSDFEAATDDYLRGVKALPPLLAIPSPEPLSESEPEPEGKLDPSPDGEAVSSCVGQPEAQVGAGDTGRKSKEEQPSISRSTRRSNPKGTTLAPTFAPLNDSEPVDGEAGPLTRVISPQLWVLVIVYCLAHCY